MNKLARFTADDRTSRSAPRRFGRARRRHARYFAFLSYSHKDKQLADWLHSHLEQFRVPRTLVGQLTENGIIPRRLTPVFRDEHELAAADDLGEEIQHALAHSRFLIVLCSPHAANSRWTNAEIETFKRAHPDGCILAAIAEGEPFASDDPGREVEECFPPALRQKYDRRGRPTSKRAEPLAADLRQAGEARRLGLLKLVAGMLGIGLDELVQRETRRRQRRLAVLAAGSLAGMAITSTLALTAIQARDSARNQRREAEGLVAFMVGDLKDKLEPIGRLDALDGVGAKVLAYYSKQDTSDLSDASLVQRSRALSLMGQVALLRGNVKEATVFYQEALAGTREALRRNPTDPQRLYDQAQNVYWIGDIAGEQGNLTGAESAYRQYKQLADKMVAMAPDNIKWRMEQEDADANLGIVLYEQHRFSDGAGELEQALRTIDALATADPRNVDSQKTLTLILAWLADARMSEGKLYQAIALRRRQIGLLNQLGGQSADVEYRQNIIPAEQGLGVLLYMRGSSAEALQHLHNAVEQAQKLIPIERNNTLWQELAYSAELYLAERALATGDRNEAAVQTAAACHIVRQLLAHDVKVPDWRAGLRDCALMRARLALSSKANAEALTDAEQAVAAARSVNGLDKFADRFELAKSYRILGDSERAAGNATAASAAWSQALEALPRGVSERPLEMDEHVRILRRVGQAAAAAKLAGQLQAMGYRQLD